MASGAEAVAKLLQVGYTDTAHARSAAAVRLVDRAANLILMMTFYWRIARLAAICDGAKLVEICEELPARTRDCAAVFRRAICVCASSP